MLGLQELSLQLGGAKLGQRRRTHVGMHRDAHRDAGAVDAAQLLAEDHGIPEVETLAAILFRIGQAEKAEVPHLLEQRVCGPDALLLPLVHVRIDFLPTKRRTSGGTSRAQT